MEMRLDITPGRTAKTYQTITATHTAAHRAHTRPEDSMRRADTIRLRYRTTALPTRLTRACLPKITRSARLEAVRGPCRHLPAAEAAATAAAIVRRLIPRRTTLRVPRIRSGRLMAYSRPPSQGPLPGLESQSSGLSWEDLLQGEVKPFSHPVWSVPAVLPCKPERIQHLFLYGLCQFSSASTLDEANILTPQATGRWAILQVSPRVMVGADVETITMQNGRGSSRLS